MRGAFKFNRNHFPIQDYYLRVVEKDAQGRITNKTVGTVFEGPRRRVRGRLPAEVSEAARRIGTSWPPCPS